MAFLGTELNQRSKFNFEWIIWLITNCVCFGLIKCSGGKQPKKNNKRFLANAYHNIKIRNNCDVVFELHKSYLINLKHKLVCKYWWLLEKLTTRTYQHLLVCGLNERVNNIYILYIKYFFFNAQNCWRSGEVLHKQLLSKKLLPEVTLKFLYVFAEQEWFKWQVLNSRYNICYCVSN